MQCKSCGKIFKSRSTFFVHTANDCYQDTNDSDENQNWAPESPPSADQIKVAGHCERLLLDFGNHIELPGTPQKQVILSEDESQSSDAVDDTDEDPDFTPSINNRCAESSTSDDDNNIHPKSKTILISRKDSSKVSDSKEAMKISIEEENVMLKEKIKQLEEKMASINNTTVPPSITENVTTSTNQPTENKDDKKKKYKKYFCPFCKHLVDHFPRHLTNKHKSEVEVTKLIGMPPKSKERSKHIALIRGRGAILYNTDNQLNKGNLITSRRSMKDLDDKTLKPCIHCHNYFKKRTLWKHYRKCTGKSAPRDLQQKSEAIILKTELLNNVNISNSLKDILPGMDKDEIFNEILNDEAIVDFGNVMCLKHTEKHLKNMIRTKIRQIAKLLLQMKNLKPEIKSLDETLNPGLYDTFVSAVKAVTGFNNGHFSAPSLVGELGRTMKLIANIRIINYIKNDNEKKKSDIEKWLHVYNHDYYNTIGRNALRALQKKKWGKTQIVPITEDIIKLNSYLSEKIKTAENTLKKEFNQEAFNSLNKCLMPQIQTFNRKRALEIEKFLISDFNKRHNIQKDSMFYKQLPPSEKLVSEKYMRVETRGKQHRKPASMLLTLKQVELITIILQHREEAGITKENPHVFARRNGTFGAYVALKEAAYASEAKQPELLIGTLLRKHIATTAQALNFTENDMVNLASFLGHDLSTHREFYRMPNEAIHLAKISKLLMAMDDGSIENFQGKSLDEINVEEQIGEEMMDTFEGDQEFIETNSQEPIEPIQEQSTATDKYEKRCKKESWNRPKKTSGKHSWKTPERQAARKVFSKFILSNENKLPTPAQCREAIKTNKELLGLSINQLKGWVSSERKRVQNQNDI